MRRLCLLLSLVLLPGFIFTVTAGELCRFDETKMEFAGTPVEQARCLLSPVLPGGNRTAPLKKLPGPLEKIVGQPVKIKPAQLRLFLEKQKVLEADLGGPVTNRITARYFVIHDISAPNYKDKAFPTNINDASWSINGLKRWQESGRAHIFVNRLGESTTAHEFAVGWRATKLEVKILGDKSRGHFIHIELIQPRRSDPKARPGNDVIAPDPGFTPAQYTRLALLYINASVQHGSWLIPGYHAGIDAGIPDAHDDPQDFVLEQWTSELDRQLKLIAKIKTK